MESINKNFIRGLLALVPIVATLYVVYQVISFLENILSGILQSLLPKYVPGLGLILVLFFIYLFGWLLNHYLTSKITFALETRFKKVPFIKAIYSPLKDLMNLFARKDSDQLKRVVLAPVGETGAYAIGLVTRETFYDLKAHATIGSRVAVYFPLSYALGGYTLLVPREKLIEIDLPVEKAMSLAVTAWIKSDKKESP